jgi:hypothetical protein
MGKNETIQIRVTDAEKRAFSESAGLAGIPLSSWVRERLRLAAIRELEGAGRRVAFVSSVPLGGADE